MSADSQTLQAKYQKLAAEFAKVCMLVQAYSAVVTETVMKADL